MQAFICKVVAEVVNPLILLIAAAAFIFFLYGLVRFISTLSNGGDTKDGKSHMFWGIIGLVIIFGAYGIINVVTGSFGIDPLAPYCRGR